MSSQAKLNDYYCGGYFLIRAENPDWVKSKDLLPERVLSVSNHIAQRLMITWGWIPGDKQAALDFGIAKEKLDDFINKWCRRSNDSEIYPGVFHTVQKARDFIEEYISEREYLHIIGIGLQKNYAEELWDENGKDIFAESINILLNQHRQLEEDGMILGYDIAGYSHTDFDCSWLCGGLEVEIKRMFDIVPNQYGLIETYPNAKKIRDLIMDSPGQYADPIEFDTWLLVSYSLA